MMKKILVLTILVLALVGCKNFEDLEAGNNLALENQNNLEKNVVRSYDNYIKVLKLYSETVGDATPEAKKEQAAVAKKIETAEAAKDVSIEQLAIGRAWLLVLQEAIKKDSLNADLMGSVITDLPGWIKDGKDIYDLIKSKK
jgi:uncharacterized lipoprotein NlpE involved in copper resistance